MGAEDAEKIVEPNEVVSGAAYVVGRGRTDGTFRTVVAACQTVFGNDLTSRLSDPKKNLIFSIFAFLDRISSVVAVVCRYVQTKWNQTMHHDGCLATAFDGHAGLYTLGHTKSNFRGVLRHSQHDLSFLFDDK